MTEPRLYIVMREDLWDMNPGKGMAQAAHAQAEFDAYLHAQVNHDDDGLWKAVSDWRGDREFGVTLVLSAPQSEWQNISLKHFGVVEDPTYPYRNYYGKMFTRSEVTCMWVFAITEEEIENMKQFDLHK